MHAFRKSGRPSVRQNRRGVAAVEFAILLPLLVTLVLGVLEIGRYVEVRQIVTAAVHEGCRQASTGQMTNSEIADVVTGCVKSAGLPTTNLTVTVNNVTAPSTDSSQATTLDELSVTASIRFRDVRWGSAASWTNDTTRVTANTVWFSTRPRSYPSDVTVPAGY